MRCVDFTKPRSSYDPAKRAEDCWHTNEIHTLNVNDYLTEKELKWSGYGLRVKSTGDNQQWAVGFDAPPAPGSPARMVELYDGDTIEMPRGFGRVWLKWRGPPDAGFYAIEVLKDPYARIERSRPIHTSKTTPLHVRSWRGDHAGHYVENAPGTALDVSGRPPTVWNTAIVDNAAAGAVLVETNQLLAGDYGVIATCAGNTDIAGVSAALQHRNAANNATLHEVMVGIGNRVLQEVKLPRITLAANERLRWVAIEAAGAAGRKYGVSLYVRRVA